MCVRLASEALVPLLLVVLASCAYVATVNGSGTPFSFEVASGDSKCLGCVLQRAPPPPPHRLLLMPLVQPRPASGRAVPRQVQGVTGAARHRQGHRQRPVPERPRHQTRRDRGFVRRYGRQEWRSPHLLLQHRYVRGSEGDAHGSPNGAMQAR